MFLAVHSYCFRRSACTIGTASLQSALFVSTAGGRGKPFQEACGSHGFGTELPTRAFSRPPIPARTGEGGVPLSSAGTPPLARSRRPLRLGCRHSLAVQDTTQRSH